MYGFFKNKRIVLYDTLIQQVLCLLMLQVSYTHIMIPVFKHNIVFLMCSARMRMKLWRLLHTSLDIGNWITLHTRSLQFKWASTDNLKTYLLISTFLFKKSCLMSYDSLNFFISDPCLLAIWRIHSCQKLHGSLQEFWIWYTAGSHWFDHISGLLFLLLDTKLMNQEGINKKKLWTYLIYHSTLWYHYNI